MTRLFGRVQTVSNYLIPQKFRITYYPECVHFQEGNTPVSGHYDERSEFFDGAVVVFHRGDAVSQGEKRLWSARFKIDGRTGFKFVSLRTRNYIDAVAKAKSLYLQFSQAVKDGASLRNQTFSQAWMTWYQTMISNNAWSDSRNKWYLSHFNRYFQSYFKDKKLDEITESFANEYFEWRKTYWTDGEGVNQVAYNRRRKGMKTHSTYISNKAASFTTLRFEQSALNQFFHWCYSTKRFMRYAIRMKAVASQRQKTDSRRATFTAQEWNVLTRNLLSWVEEKGKYAGGRLNSFHRHQRQQLRFYVLFLASTGIRSGTETRFMKWSDISLYKDSDEIEHLKIRIRAKTKKGVSRTVMSQPNAVAWLQTWRSMSHYSGDQDYVWYGTSKGQEQKVATDLNKTFQAFLKTVEYQGREDGLLNDPDGGRRSLYSLRHFYASQRLLHNVSYEDLRRNMGTGVQQLVKHYDHVLTEQRAAEITKTKLPADPEAEPRWPE
jgi:hypothetical protein